MADNRPLPSKVPPDFDIDPNPGLTQNYRQKIQHYIGHPPPFTKQELIRASNIMFYDRHPEANPLLFRSMVGPAGITKKGYMKDFKDKKEEYLAFQRALYSLDTESQQAQLSSFWAPPPFHSSPTSSFRAPTTSLSPLVTTTGSGSIGEKIARLTTTHNTTKSKVVKAACQNQIDQLRKQLRKQQQQQQQQQQGPPGNGGGKKYKKCFTNKKRRYKKRSKSIKK
jgi:hypothetical protein